MLNYFTCEKGQLIPFIEVLIQKVLVLPADHQLHLQKAQCLGASPFCTANKSCEICHEK